MDIHLIRAFYLQRNRFVVTEMGLPSIAISELRDAELHITQCSALRRADAAWFAGREIHGVSR
jgi:hypothetical protein